MIRLACTCLLALAVQSALAQPETRQFDIPATTLARALEAFTKQSEMAVTAPDERVAGRRSPGVSGRLTPRAALQRLLTGTGLDFRTTATDEFTLVVAGAGEGEALQPVTVAATRTATPASRLTRSVTVIDKNEIEQRKQTAKSVGELLAQSVPGFSPSTEALTDFGQTLRGRNFLTLIDGVPQSTPLRDGRRALNTINANAIERIEVVRGGTAAYGFGATGGLVNIITRRPEPGSFNAHSSLGLSTSTTQEDDSVIAEANQRVSGRRGDLDYVFSGSIVERNSFFDDEGDRIPADPNGVQGGLADTQEWNILAKAGYEPAGGRQRIELTLNQFEVFQDSDFAGLGQGDPATRRKTPAEPGNINVADPGTENTLINLQYRHDAILGGKLNSQLYYGDLTTRFGKFPGFPQVEVTSDKLGARVTLDTPLRLAATDFTLTWGADYLADETNQDGLDAPSTTPNMDQDAIAGFAQVELPLAGWGLLRTGVRHEDIRVDVDDIVNRRDIFVQGGRLDFSETLFNLTGAVYLSDQMELYGGFSQGFSLADLGRAISDGMADQATDLETEAQKVDNYELGLRGFGSGWEGAITAFYSESDNGTSFDADLNITKQPEEIYGVEASANYRVTNALRVGGTATWQEGEVDLDNDGSFEEELPSTRIPPVKVTAFVEYSAYDWWRTRLEALHSGDRDPDSTQFGNGEVEDYTVLDWRNQFDTGYGEVGLGVSNLLNEGYFPVLAQAQALPFAFSRAPGRRVSLNYALDW